jgi:hypothetical protein
MILYACSSLEIVDNVQRCIEYVPLTSSFFFSNLAITQSDSIAISIEMAKICGILIAYSFIMKAAKLA